MVTEEFEELIVELAEYKRTHFFGKFRGLVKTVGKDSNLGYIKAIVPEIYGETEESPWAAPAVPFAGKGHGLVALPEEKDGVWIEFESGNISHPIWTGFWWGDDEIPDPKGVLIRTFITTAGHKLILDDENNEVKLLHADGAELTMTNSDIIIKIGQAKAEMSDGEISLKVGTTAMSPEIKISSSEISLQNGAKGSLKVSSSDVDICRGAIRAT